jgi:hypothetical protein
MDPGAFDALAGHQDLARLRRLEPRDRPQQGRLATAGRADQHADVTRLHPQRHPVHRGTRAPGIVDAQLAKLEMHAADSKYIQFSFT